MLRNIRNNDPEKKYAFTYDSYNKLFFDILSDTATLSPELAQDTSFQKEMDRGNHLQFYLVACTIH